MNGPDLLQQQRDVVPNMLMSKVFRPVPNNDHSQWNSQNQASAARAPKRSFWTKAEEDILQSELSDSHFIGFQEILDKHKGEFHPSRTASSLEGHYYKMKKLGLCGPNASTTRLSAKTTLAKRNETLCRAIEGQLSDAKTEKENDFGVAKIDVPYSLLIDSIKKWGKNVNNAEPLAVKKDICAKKYSSARKDQWEEKK